MHNYLLTGKSHPKANKFEVNKNDHNSRIKSPIKNQVVCFNQTFILVPCFN